MNDDYELDESKTYGLGWAFFKCSGDEAPPGDGCDLQEWMRGFCAALAEYGEQEYPTIQAALVDLRITGPLLEACLKAAEAVREGSEWCRWPSMPIRGRSVVRVLEAANDEMG